MDSPTPTIRIENFQDAAHYTEALVTLHASVSGAEPIPTDDGLVAPTTITVHYEWRTQLGHGGWCVGTVEVVGPKVTPGKQPGHDDNVTLVLTAIQLPGWLSEVIAEFMPTSRLAVGVAGMDVPGNVPLYVTYEFGPIGPVRLTGVYTSTRLRHQVHSLYVHGAPLEVLPGDVGAPDQYMVPEYLSVGYERRCQWRSADYAWCSEWRVRTVTVTGSFATAEGHRVPGTLQGSATARTTPQWALACAAANLPSYVGLMEGESTSDIALWQFNKALTRYSNISTRRAEAEESDGDTGEDVIRLCEREDDSAGASSDAAETLVCMLNDGAPIPAAWANNPTPGVRFR